MKIVLFVGCVFLAVSLGFVLTGCGSGEEEAIAQQSCPVMGGKVNKNFYTDYKGKRVYFCCGGCPSAFKKDPETYIKKLETQGITLEPAPKPKKRSS